MGGDAKGKQAQALRRLDKLLKAYSSGEITRRDLEEKTGLWFGDVLRELGRRGLSLPRVDSTALLNDKQKALQEAVFGKSGINSLVAAIREERIRRGLSLSGLAKRAGVSRGAVAGLEDFKNCRVSTLFKVLNALGIEVVVRRRSKKGKR